MKELTPIPDVAQPIADVTRNIAKAKESSPLAFEGNICLLGASKGQGRALIEAAIKAGMRDFGENRVQEAADKWPEIKNKYPEVRLHCIGALQRNKVAAAVALFDVIQTVDREALAEALAAEMHQQGRKLACYVQVNTGAEPQKAGVSVEETEALVAKCRMLGLDVVGLMCVPPVGQHPAPHFALLAKLAVECGLKGLSMGMSEDYETAVRMGASCVRLGRVIFGERA